MGYNKKNMEILADIYESTSNGMMSCPNCGGNLIIVQVEPISDYDNAYTPYDTVIECSYCSFNLRAESFTILGSVKEFDSHSIKIGSWSDSGSRVLSKYEHILDYDLLKDLRTSGELVEFIVVNNQVIEVVG